jgi:iron complex transport system ATP-binding protein
VTPLLRVRGAGWHANNLTIIDGITFDVSAGELVAVMGKNGAGKSTLLDLIAGLRRPSVGVLELSGRPLHAWSAAGRARVVGHLPQAIPAELPFTVEQVVLMGRYPHADRWFESDADREAVARAMSRCECAGFEGRRVSTLSGGERQRVLLAACLAQEPELLLLDEPGAFLDIEQQLHCYSLLREETARGTACLTVTHDVNLALAFCTRLIILADRSVAYDLPVEVARARTDWLALFSSRLRRTSTADGQPWICYQ